MGVNLGVKGELVFENEEKCSEFFNRLGIDLRKEARESENLRILEIRRKDGRCHVRFEGKTNWPSKISPPDEDPLDWLESQVLALLWDVEDLKSLEVYKAKDIKFEFYTEEEIEKKRDEYNKWWMESASNITSLF
jgi:hypothetical protein